ncbi:MAG: hypothetical protein PUG15_04760 [Bacteroidales bacterium]|nr:hypothetical protein [Bacteroidales bacterium]
MKDIGSIFALKSKNISSPRKFWSDNKRQYFALCREVLFQIATLHQKSNRIALLPAYTCATVSYPFEQLGWKIEYYAIKRNLRIDNVDLSCKIKKNRPAIVLAHPYYGQDFNAEEIECLQIAKEKYHSTLIVDVTQCYYSKQRLAFVDYYVGSLYKWFPIVDGGFVESKFALPAPKEEYVSYVSLQQEAMYLRSIYLGSEDDYIKTISRRINKDAVAISNGVLSCHKMSDISQKLMSQIEESEAERQRLENYSYIAEYTKWRDGIRMVINKNKVTSAPLYFPIYCENSGKMQRVLADSHIYAPLLWSLYSEQMLVNNDVKWIYEHILALPIDQRYNEEDMKRIVETINVYE